MVISKLNEPLDPNPTELLSKQTFDQFADWVTKDTAILVVHGIGNQFPLETIDEFGRGLLAQYQSLFPGEISLSHHVVPKDDDSGGFWMDNVLRIKKEGSAHHIDVYEYYWAHHTEDAASWSDLSRWLEGVVKGANTFYEQNAMIGYQYKDKSIFFDSVTGKFKVGNYRFFISAVGKTFLVIDVLIRAILWIVSFIPLMGRVAESLIKSYSQSLLKEFTNVVGDVVVYNVVDPKNKFYQVRKKIQMGAVKAIKNLIEQCNRTNGEDTSFCYGTIIVAAHSLGSQVAYDAINQINLLVNQSKVKHYTAGGDCDIPELKGTRISDQLKGFITFGSPLDKIVFFLRENVPTEQFLRAQLLSQFHGFKIRNLNLMTTQSAKQYTPIQNQLHRFLDDIPWRNYFDNHDYVSGGLDYFQKVTNIDCQFKAGRLGFTHSDYWTCAAFYKDIIQNFLK